MATSSTALPSYQRPHTPAHLYLVQTCGRVDALLLRVLRDIAGTYSTEGEELSKVRQSLALAASSEQRLASELVFEIWNILKHEMAISDKLSQAFPAAITTIYMWALDRLGDNHLDVSALRELAQMTTLLWPSLRRLIVDNQNIASLPAPEVKEASVEVKLSKDDYVAKGTLKDLRDSGWRDLIKGLTLMLGDGIHVGEMAKMCAWSGTVAHVRFLVAVGDKGELYTSKKKISIPIQRHVRILRSPESEKALQKFEESQSGKIVQSIIPPP